MQIEWSPETQTSTRVFIIYSYRFPSIQTIPHNWIVSESIYLLKKSECFETAGWWQRIQKNSLLLPASQWNKAMCSLTGQGEKSFSWESADRLTRAHFLASHMTYSELHPQRRQRGEQTWSLRISFGLKKVCDNVAKRAIAHLLYFTEWNLNTWEVNQSRQSTSVWGSVPPIWKAFTFRAERLLKNLPRTQ